MLAEEPGHARRQARHRQTVGARRGVQHDVLAVVRDCKAVDEALVSSLAGRDRCVLCIGENHRRLINRSLLHRDLRLHRSRIAESVRIGDRQKAVACRQVVQSVLHITILRECRVGREKARYRSAGETRDGHGDRQAVDELIAVVAHREAKDRADRRCTHGDQVVLRSSSDRRNDIVRDRGSQAKAVGAARYVA